MSGPAASVTGRGVLAAGVHARVLATAFARSPVGIGLLDLDGRVIHGNARLAQLLELPPRRIRGVRLAEAVDDAERARFESCFRVLLRRRAGRQHVEARLQGGEGGSFWARISLSVLELPGASVQVLAVVEDTNRRRSDDQHLRRRTVRLAEVVRMQEELAAADLSLESVGNLVLEGVTRLVGGSGAALAIVDVEDSEPRTWPVRAASGTMCDSAVAVTGFECGLCSECLRTRQVVISSDTQHDERCAAAVGLLVEHRSMLLAPVMHKGRLLAVVAAGSREVAAFGPDDATSVQLVSGLIGSALSNAREYEDHKAFRERLALLTASCPVAIVACDTTGLITVATGAAMVDLTDPAGLVGRSIIDAFQNYPAMQDCVRSALAGSSQNVLVEIRGRNRHFEVRVEPVLDAHGRVAGATAIGIDITDRVMARIARQESDAKSRFLATMSHELRTPLNSVMGFSQLLASPDFGLLTDRQRRHVENIRSSAKHLLSLINELLDIGRIQAGELELTMERVHLGELLGDAVAGIRPQARAAALQVSLECAPELWVSADPRRLRQAVLNLLSNAIKFTPPGGSVTVTARRDGRQTEIVVADTGVGVPSDQLERIFEEFAQLPPQPGSQPEGSGLGLTVTRQLLALMGGRIVAESQPGRGSVFTVRLPQAYGG